MAPPRSSGPSRVVPDDEDRSAQRDVYEADYLVRGKWYAYSVNSRGELHGERLVARDAPRWKKDDAIESLWRELDVEDPIPHHGRPPSLRRLK